MMLHLAERTFLIKEIFTFKTSANLLFRNFFAYLN